MWDPQTNNLFYTFKWLLYKYLHYVLYFACRPVKYQIFTIWIGTEKSAESGIHYVKKKIPDLGFSALLASKFLCVDLSHTEKIYTLSRGTTLSATQLWHPAQGLGFLLCSPDRAPPALENHKVQVIIPHPLISSQSE